MSVTSLDASAPFFDRLPRLPLDVVVERLDLAASPTEPHARAVDELVHLTVDLRLLLLGVLDGLEQVAALDEAARRVEVELIGSKRKDAGVALERDIDDDAVAGIVVDQIRAGPEVTPRIAGDVHLDLLHGLPRDVIGPSAGDRRPRSDEQAPLP